jgi:hypothetical protein
MQKLVRALVGLCIFLTIATERMSAERHASGELVIHWTRATFWRTYRLRGTYTIWGSSNGVIATLQSPSDGATSIVALPPGLYGVQLEPGACLAFESLREVSSEAPREPAAERCASRPPAAVFVIVEPGGRSDVALSVRPESPRTAESIAMHD